MVDTTWSKEIARALEAHGESWSDVITCTLTPEEREVVFDDGYGSIEGKPFTAWTKDWVYFPVCYDGAEWVGSAPRNPCDIATEHQGGG